MKLKPEYLALVGILRGAKELACRSDTLYPPSSRWIEAADATRELERYIIGFEFIPNFPDASNRRALEELLGLKGPLHALGSANNWERDYLKLVGDLGTAMRHAYGETVISRLRRRIFGSGPSHTKDQSSNKYSSLPDQISVTYKGRHQDMTGAQLAYLVQDALDGLPVYTTDNLKRVRSALASMEGTSCELMSGNDSLMGLTARVQATIGDHSNWAQVDVSVPTSVREFASGKELDYQAPPYLLLRFVDTSSELYLRKQLVFRRTPSTFAVFWVTVAA